MAKWLIIDNQRTSVSITATGERKFNVDTTPYVDQLGRVFTIDYSQFHFFL